MTETCVDCKTIEEAKNVGYCGNSLDCSHYVPLKGEGDVETVKRIRKRHICNTCGLPATHRLTFLLFNARFNPASSGYRGDDISRCSDQERFTCDDCKDKVMRDPPRGHSWCSSFPLDRFPHMGLYWSEVKE